MGKVKNFMAVVVMSVLYLVFLLTRFSALGCIVSAASIGCLFIWNYTTVDSGSYGVIERTGQYFGITVCDCMLVTLFSTGVSLKDISRVNVSNPLLWTALVVTVVVVIIVSKLHKASNIFARVGKYLLLCALAVFLCNIFIEWTLPVYVYCILAYAALTAIAECIGQKYSNDKKRDPAFYWFIVNVVVFACIEVFYPNQSIDIIDRFANIALISWRWYVFVLIELACVILGAVFWAIDSEGKKYPYDTKLCLAVGVDLLMVPYLLNTYTSFCFIPFCLLAVLNLVIFFGSFKNDYFNLAGVQFTKSDFIFTTGVIIIALVYRGFIYGNMWSYIILFAAVMGGAGLYKFKSGRNGWLFWEYIVLAMGVFVAEYVYRSYNDIKSFKYILFVCILATFVLIILNIKNSKRFTADAGAKLTAVVCAALMIFFPVRHFGAKYRIMAENKVEQADPELSRSLKEATAIVIDLTPRGKENSIEKCYYYWSNEASDVKEVPKEEAAHFSIEPANGVLHLYTQDKYGVVSTQTRWFDFRNMWERKSAGHVRP